MCETCQDEKPHGPHLYEYEGVIFKCEGVMPHG